MIIKDTFTIRIPKVEAYRADDLAIRRAHSRFRTLNPHRGLERVHFHQLDREIGENFEIHTYQVIPSGSREYQI